MKISDSAKYFVDIVKELSYLGKGNDRILPLYNMTFFLGAGFSKSWDIKYPTGPELFNINPWSHDDSFLEFTRKSGYTDGNLDISELKEVFYSISMQKKYPALRMRYSDQSNLVLLENDIKAIITKKFNKIIPLNYAEEGKLKLELNHRDEPHRLNILRFFRWIRRHSTGDNPFYAEGLRANYLTTNYDFLIESIIDSCLGEDDFHILYTYRGFTPKKINNIKRLTTFHDHELVENLIKINGGFEIYESIDGSFELDYRKKSEEELSEKAPVLILPNREQDYTGNYFQTIFPKAIRTLHESKILVIVGYSIPEEDALIRILLRQFAEEAIDAKQKLIFYIDLLSEKDQREKLSMIFPYHKPLKRGVNVITYSGSFTNWIKEVLSQI